TATREIRAVLAESKFIPIDGGLTAAHSSVLEPCVAEGWLAAGDASLSFDPLSAQGLLHALFTGLAAAEAADACLSGDGEAVSRYRQLMDGILSGQPELPERPHPPLLREPRRASGSAGYRGLLPRPQARLLRVRSRRQARHESRGDLRWRLCRAERVRAGARPPPYPLRCGSPLPF